MWGETTLKKQTVKTTITCALAALFLCAGAYDGRAFAADAFSATDVSDAITAKTPCDGQTVSLVNDSVLELLEMDYFDVAWVQSLYEVGQDNYAPVITLSWNGVENATAYGVRVATDEDFINVEERFSVVGATEVKMIAPKANTHYFWQVSAQVGEKKIVSDVFSFQTADTLRTVYIDGVTNTRDVGGKSTSLGVMKQGQVYRGAGLKWNSAASDTYIEGTPKAYAITAAGIRTIKRLGIQTELDLRSAGETGQDGTSPAGIENYVQISSPFYAGGHAEGIDKAANYAAVKSIMQVFANADNYPIYMHCSYGKDRTGTISYLLNALCGASKTQCWQDFWLSMYAESGAIQKENVQHTYDVLMGLHNFINGQSGKTYADKTANYLKTVGLSEQEIAQIRNNLLIYAQ